MDNAAKIFSKHINYTPKLEKDIRKVVDDNKVDAIFNATPDHWHAHGSMMAMKNSKHVYVEKPCSHNIFDNKLLVAATKKFNRIVQMGNQQRSSVTPIE